MKTKALMIALMSILSLNSINTLNAQESKVEKKIIKRKTATTGIIDNTLTNKNMFFGMNFGNNTMNQLYVEVYRGTDKEGITYNTWTNFDTKQGKIVEIDQSLGYLSTIKIDDKNTLRLQPTVAYYTFPNSSMNDCQEIYIKTDYTGPADIKLRAGKAFGKDSGKGWMMCANISKTITTKKMAYGINIGSVYNSEYFAPNCKGISHLEGTASLSYTPLPDLSINLNHTVQKRISKSFVGSVNDENYWKMGVTYSF